MNRRTAFLGLLVVLGAVTAVWWYYQRVASSWGSALTSREIATRVLGERLARMHPGSKALVIGNPFTLRKGQDPEVYAFEKAAIRGLKTGFGSPARIKVVYPEIRPEFLRAPQSVFIDPKTTTPLSYLIAQGEFDRLARANTEYDLIVTLIGLPVDITASRVWTESPKPHFGLLLPDWRMLGGAEAAAAAVQSGKIAAAVIDRPGSDPSEAPEPDKGYHAEFDRRFLLVTEENIDEALRTYLRLW